MGSLEVNVFGILALQRHSNSYPNPPFGTPMGVPKGGWNGYYWTSEGRWTGSRSLFRVSVYLLRLKININVYLLRLKINKNVYLLRLKINKTFVSK